MYKRQGQIILVPPYFENFGKRLVKSPKVYWGDTGLACHLLGIQTQAELERSPFLGSIFEGFVAAEILKSQVNRGQRKELYYFRDQQGLEIDFVVPRPNARFWLVEAKASKTEMCIRDRPASGRPRALRRRARHQVRALAGRGLQLQPRGDGADLRAAAARAANPRRAARTHRAHAWL